MKKLIKENLDTIGILVFLTIYTLIVISYMY